MNKPQADLTNPTMHVEQNTAIANTTDHTTNPTMHVEQNTDQDFLPAVPPDEAGLARAAHLADKWRSRMKLVLAGELVYAQCANRRYARVWLRDYVPRCALTRALYNIEQAREAIVDQLTARGYEWSDHGASLRVNLNSSSPCD